LLKYNYFNFKITVRKKITEHIGDPVWIAH